MDAQGGVQIDVFARHSEHKVHDSNLALANGNTDINTSPNNIYFIFVI